MAEDTQEDLSMEDILSSIKDILLEDSSEQQKMDKVSAPQAAAADEAQKAAPAVEPDVLEDVLTLSPSMIVEPTLSVETPAEQPAVSAEEGADPLDLDFEHEFESLPAEPVLDDVPTETAVPETADKADDSFELGGLSIESKDNFSLEDSDAEAILSGINIDGTVSDVESEPIFSPEDEASSQDSFSAPAAEEDLPSLDNLIDDATLNAILDAQPEEPETQTDLAEEFVEPTDNVYENAVSNPTAEPEAVEVEYEPVEEVPEEAAPAQPEAPEVISEPDPIYVPEEAEAFAAPEAQPGFGEAVAEAETTLPASEEETSASEDEAVDISANIISNFAKMFAEQQKEKAAPAVEQKQQLAEQVMKEIELGDGSLTIEAIVREVVADIVEKNLSADFDFAAAASAEIAKQTKAWLSANLPAIVEAAVKKEIERVMAKVSS